MTRAPGFFALLLFAAACGRGDAESVSDSNATAWRSPEGETCAECHARLSPGLVADHEASAHRSIPLHCESCHGTDHNKIFADKGGVPPTVCAACHAEAYEEFAASRHGQRLKGG